MADKFNPYDVSNPFLQMPGIANRQMYWETRNDFAAGNTHNSYDMNTGRGGNFTSDRATYGGMSDRKGMLSGPPQGAGGRGMGGVPGVSLGRRYDRRLESPSVIIGAMDKAINTISDVGGQLGGAMLGYRAGRRAAAGGPKAPPTMPSIHPKDPVSPHGYASLVPSSAAEAAGRASADAAAGRGPFSPPPNFNGFPSGTVIGTPVPVSPFIANARKPRYSNLNPPPQRGASSRTASAPTVPKLAAGGPRPSTSITPANPVSNFGYASAVPASAVVPPSPPSAPPNLSVLSSPVTPTASRNPAVSTYGSVFPQNVNFPAGGLTPPQITQPVTRAGNEDKPAAKPARTGRKKSLPDINQSRVKGAIQRSIQRSIDESQ